MAEGCSAREPSPARHLCHRSRTHAAKTCDSFVLPAPLPCLEHTQPHYGSPLALGAGHAEVDVDEAVQEVEARQSCLGFPTSLVCSVQGSMLMLQHLHSTWCDGQSEGKTREPVPRFVGVLTEDLRLKDRREQRLQARLAWAGAANPKRLLCCTT